MKADLASRFNVHCACNSIREQSGSYTVWSAIALYMKERGYQRDLKSSTERLCRCADEPRDDELHL